jgi:alpha-1,2-mannosyltransferase
VAVASPRVWSVVLFAVLPLGFLALVFYAMYAKDSVAIDFHYVYYPAAEEILDGRSPFFENEDPFKRFVYTPLLAFLVAPLTILPLGLADLLVTLALLAMWMATPFVLGVRDWRVVTVTLLWAPFVSALQTANVTILLVFLAALAWRWRDRKVLAGVAIGLAVGLKLFLWPLAFWLLATRRFVSLAVASAVVAVSFLTVLPYESLPDFASRLREHGKIFDEESYTLYAYLVELGAPAGVARAAWLALGVTVLVLGRKSFSLCLVAALLLSPLVWLHYLTLLVIPLALSSAPLWVWFLPVPLAFADGGALNGGIGVQTLVLSTFAAIVVLCLWLSRRARPDDRESSDVEREPVVGELELVGRR